MFSKFHDNSGMGQMVKLFIKSDFLLFLHHMSSLSPVTHNKEI